MLNEPASSLPDFPPLRPPAPEPQEQLVEGINQDTQEIVSQVFLIDRAVFHHDGETLFDQGVFIPGLNNQLIATFEGRLRDESEAAYAQLDAQLASLDRLPIFREIPGTESGLRQVIYIVEGREKPGPRAWWPNLVMFLMTFASVLFIGSLSSGKFDTLEQLQNDPLLLRYGLPYALSILAILGAHELGHYFVARHHKVSVTLPYFIPFPFNFFGTLGAFIQLREPMKNRKVLMDVGAAGPLAGLVVAIPILIVGLMTSEVHVLTEPGLVEGNSIVYALTKFFIFGRFLPNGTSDVFINQLATAGWTGLLVTALNLIPIGQLDGGHILYSLIGDRARRFYYPLLLAMITLALFVNAWLPWVLLLVIFGRVHATPLDDITRLDPRRRLVSIMALIIFVLIFVPIPIKESTPPQRERQTIEQPYVYVMNIPTIE